MKNKVQIQLIETAESFYCLNGLHAEDESSKDVAMCVGIITKAINKHHEKHIDEHDDKTFVRNSENEDHSDEFYIGETHM